MPPARCAQLDYSAIYPVNVHLRAEGLKVLDLLSKSDPFARILFTGGDDEEYELGRTEVCPTPYPNLPQGLRTPLYRYTPKHQAIP